MAAKKKGQAKGSRKVRARRETGSRSIGQKLLKGLNHPLRVQILAVLNDRMASPSELSKELKEGLSQVSYHVNALVDFGMIELVKTEPRRGAVEHYYRADAKVLIPSWVLKLLPRSAQRGVWGSVLADIEQDVGTSLETGTFDKRDDLVVGRDSRNLDGIARAGAEELAAEFYERWEQLEVDTDRRIANDESDGEIHPTTAAVLIFGSAEGKKLKSRKKRNK